ncbi:MAG: hypothetical protein JNM98_18660 [Rhodocyclaceae bacterium]|nr:hypothetical protein [Rhodocyclaceae bacterium]
MSDTVEGVRLTDESGGEPKKTYEKHRERHAKLHGMLDELVADWITETGCLPSKSSVMELMQWSYMQTFDPSDKQGRFLPMDATFAPGKD